MYKVIVSDLVSLDTNLLQIKGSYLFNKLDFYEESVKAKRFHYKVNVGRFHIPNTHDFRHGYYFKNGDSWFYKRKVFGLSLKMEFHVPTKTFYFNKLYMIIPFEIGGILPPGKHLTDMITLELSLSDLIVIRGCAYKYKAKSHVFIRPSVNGKTTLILDALRDGAQYISEDVLIIDPKESTLYPTAALPSNFGRDVNASLYSLAKKRKITKKQSIKKINIILPSERYQNIKPASIKENYYILNSLLFLDNRFIRAFIAESRLANNILFENINSFIKSKFQINVEKTLNNQNINAAHWEKLGKNYYKAWNNPAKQAMSNKELTFVSDSIITSKSPRILDVGVGTGRIIKHLAKKIPNSKIYGIDVARSMVKTARIQTSNFNQIKRIEQCDISKLDIPYRGQFDAITSVRVLKYSKNWQSIVHILSLKLKPGGTITFSMTNKNSLNRFGRYYIPFERTTPHKLNLLAKDLELEIVNIRGFSRLPDCLYDYSSKELYVKYLLKCESLIEKMFPSWASRELFITLRKPIVQ
jgi:2-polyprenyl-3-methyl-5-hydroxy-6-metoxy-1,4-benzoquinol methylase